MLWNTYSVPDVVNMMINKKDMIRYSRNSMELNCPKSNSVAVTTHYRNNGNCQIIVIINLISPLKFKNNYANRCQIYKQEKDQKLGAPDGKFLTWYSSAILCSIWGFKNKVQCFKTPAHRL